MNYSCDTCGSTFSTKLKRDLHRDSCGEDELFCRECGEQFAANRATQDGWYYECPTEDCEGSGIGEELVKVDEVRVAASR